MGELAERQAEADAARLSRCFVTWSGRCTTLPADLDSIPSPGLRAAVAAEQRYLDNAPDERPAPPPARPHEATQRLPRADGGSLLAQWAEVDAWRAEAMTPHQRLLAERAEEKAFRAWALRRGWRVSKSRGERPEWSARPESEEALRLADERSLTRTKSLRAPSLEKLRGQLEALVGPREEGPRSAPPPAKKRRAVRIVAAGQLGLFGSAT